MAFGKKVLAKVRGMTPARFDMLYVLRGVALKGKRPPSTVPTYPRNPRYPRMMQEEHEETQVSLGRKLGLHRSTICEMVQNLEAMGWITRRRCETDRRTYVVSLTARGLRRIWQAMRLVFRTPIVRSAYERIFGPKEPEEPFELFYRGLWKGDYASAAAASEELHEARSKPGWDPFEGQTPAAVVLDEVYGTLRKIARGFGDHSYVWFHLGRGLPKVV